MASHLATLYKTNSPIHPSPTQPGRNHANGLRSGSHTKHCKQSSSPAGNVIPSMRPSLLISAHVRSQLSKHHGTSPYRSHHTPPGIKSSPTHTVPTSQKQHQQQAAAPYAHARTHRSAPVLRIVAHRALPQSSTHERQQTEAIMTHHRLDDSLRFRFALSSLTQHPGPQPSRTKISPVCENRFFRTNYTNPVRGTPHAFCGQHS